MAKGATHVLGIDLGTQTTKVVELQLSGQDIALPTLPVIVPTAEGAVQDGQVVNADAAAETLRHALSLARFSTKDVIVSVAGDPMVIIRVGEMARLSGKDLEDAVKFEIGRHSQFGIEELFYDYAILDPDDAPADAQNMEVLLAAAHEEVVNATVKAVMSARLAPVGVDVQPLAMARAAAETIGPEAFDQTACCLHVGATYSVIVMVRKGLSNFIRFLPQAGQAFTAALRSSGISDQQTAEYVKRAWADVSVLTGMEPSEESGMFEVSDSSAHEALEPESEDATLVDLEAPAEAVTEPSRSAPPPATAPAPAQPAQVRTAEEQQIVDNIAAALEQIVSDIATEVRRSVDFYRRQHRNEPIDRIVLSGGGALLRGLSDLIASETGIRCQLANPFVNMTLFDDSDQTKAYLQEVGPVVSIAAGLALRDLIEAPVAARG
jgi:type IV pilus assembly protein PilM